MLPVAGTITIAQLRDFFLRYKSYSSLIKKRLSTEYCSREAYVRHCTEGTWHKLSLQYGGKCHIYETLDLGPDFSTGSSPYFFLHKEKEGTRTMKAVHRGHQLAHTMKFGIL